MTARGYTSTGAVEAYLGRTFDDPQTAQAATLLETAEEFIDLQTQQSWLTGPITAEGYLLRPVRTRPVIGLVSGTSILGGVPTPTQLYLKRIPVSSIQAITARPLQIGATSQALVAGVDYELIDPQWGRVLFLPGWGGATRVAVSYTPVQTVPVGITLIATQLVAHWLTYNIDPDRYGLSSYSLGQDLKIQTDTDSTQHLVPTEIGDALMQRSRVIFG